MNTIKTSYSPYRLSFRDEQAGLKSKSLSKLTDLKSKEVLKIDLNANVLMGILLVVSVLLGALYLLNYNNLATKGYHLKKLEIARQELQVKSNEQNLYLARVKSLSQMLDEEKFDGMRKPSNMIYVEGESFVAKAD